MDKEFLVRGSGNFSLSPPLWSTDYMMTILQRGLPRGRQFGFSVWSLIHTWKARDLSFSLSFVLLIKPYTPSDGMAILIACLFKNIVFSMKLRKSCFYGNMLMCLFKSIWVSFFIKGLAFLPWLVSLWK